MARRMGMMAAGWALAVVMLTGGEARGQADADKIAKRQKQVAQLLAEAQTLYKLNQHLEAADLLRQAVVIDPLNEQTHLMLRLIEGQRPQPRPIKPQAVGELTQQLYDIRAALVDIEQSAVAPREKARLRAERVEQLRQMIVKGVDPESWQHGEFGGGRATGTLREEEGKLIVMQTRANHLAVKTLLEKHWEGNYVRVAIEMRLILMDGNLQDLKLDWKTAKPAEGIARRAVLNNYQLNLLLTTTQADKHAVTATSPRITICNGTEGVANIGERPKYISGYRRMDPTSIRSPWVPVRSNLEPAFQAVCTPTISEGQKSVRLSINMVWLNLMKMETVAAPGVPAHENLQVEVPVLMMKEMWVEETVSDGGTALFDLGLVAGRQRALVLLRPTVYLPEGENLPAPPEAGVAK